MSEKIKKRGLNLKLLLFSVFIVAAIVWPVLSAIKASRPDISASKQKITRQDLVEFQNKVADMVASYTVRHEGEIPIVHPPADSDIYLLGRNYHWGKYILELEQGQPYRLHLASLDMPHALVIYELRMIHKIKVGQFTTVSFAPDRAGRFEMHCGDYCGPGHKDMTGAIIVTATGTNPPPSDN